MSEKRRFTDQDVQFIFDYVEKVLPTFPVPKAFNERLEKDIIDEFKDSPRFLLRFKDNIIIDKFKISPLGWVWDFSAGNMGEFRSGSPLLIGTVFRDDELRNFASDNNLKNLLRLIIHENIHYTLFQKFHRRTQHTGWGKMHLKQGIHFDIEKKLSKDFLQQWDARDAK